MFLYSTFIKDKSTKDEIVYIKIYVNFLTNNNS